MNDGTLHNECNTKCTTIMQIKTAYQENSMKDEYSYKLYLASISGRDYTGKVWTFVRSASPGNFAALHCRIFKFVDVNVVLML